ncbi:MAG: hypothetical protein IIU35_05390, partial [Neisseriaceae bacterium]|nr:hypothetical protein [Neisseriaceae bacterium]
MEKKMIFSKFISLDYNFKDENNKTIYCPKLSFDTEKNKRFKQILETSSLYASSFDEMNDIDECTYSIEYPTEFLQQCNEIVANILDIKKEKRICCFSCDEDEKFKEDLMWAHYANACLGVKIIFSIKDNYAAFPVKYDDEK